MQQKNFNFLNFNFQNNLFNFIFKTKNSNPSSLDFYLFDPKLFKFILPKSFTTNNESFPHKNCPSVKVKATWVVNNFFV